MTKTTITAGILVLAILIGGAWAYAHYSPGSSPESSSERALTQTVTYSCDKGKTITAAYYEGPEAPQPAPGEVPTPTGSVDVSIGGAATTTLMQTISADGIRYASADESLVFWSKGDEALVLRNNSMDLEYTNCSSSPAAPASPAASDTPANGPVTVSGTMTCLPHKDTMGPQTLECAIGFKDDSGRYFALTSSDPSVTGSIPSDTHVQISGTFTARSDSKYQDIGVIAVSSVETR